MHPGSFLLVPETVPVKAHGQPLTEHQRHPCSCSPHATWGAGVLQLGPVSWLTPQGAPDPPAEPSPGRTTQFQGLLHKTSSPPTWLRDRPALAGQAAPQVVSLFPPSLGKCLLPRGSTLEYTHFIHRRPPCAGSVPSRLPPDRGPAPSRSAQ